MTLALAGLLHLGTLLIAALFSYFALQKLRRGQRKWVPIAVFLVLVVLVLDGFVFFVNQAIKAVPHVLEKSVPQIIDYAKAHNIPLPFDDVEGLKSTLVETVKDELHFVG